PLPLTPRSISPLGAAIGGVVGSETLVACAAGAELAVVALGAAPHAASKVASRTARSIVASNRSFTIDSPLYLSGQTRLRLCRCSRRSHWRRRSARSARTLTVSAPAPR